MNWGKIKFTALPCNRSLFRDIFKWYSKYSTLAFPWIETSHLNVSLTKLYGSFCVYVHLLTLVSEGGGGGRRGDRVSRCGDGTLAYRLLHDAPPVHLLHHVFYIETSEETGRKQRIWQTKETQSERGVWRRMVRSRMGEEKHFRGILQDQYNSRPVSMVNSLSCIQFAHFHKPQNHFCQQSSLSCSWKQKGVTGECKREESRESRFRLGDGQTIRMSVGMLAFSSLIMIHNPTTTPEVWLKKGCTKILLLCLQCSYFSSSVHKQQTHCSTQPTIYDRQ